MYSPKVAFVTGANGITGHAIVEHLTRKPEKEWSKIIITSRRPLSNYWIDPRVHFVAIDFLEPVERIAEQMKGLCNEVTHAYFTSYIHSDDFKLLREKNVPLFRNFIDSLDRSCPKLQRVCLQTGGKYYGGHLGPVKAPVVESLPRYDDEGFNFYYAQEDYLKEMQERRHAWSYNIIRPNAIIGFAPRANGMSEALTLAIYFLISRELNQPPEFPGNEFLWNSVDDNSYAPSLADLSIWATTQDHCQNEAFNHCNGDVFVWKYFWADIGKYFGLEVPEPSFGKATGQGQTQSNEFDMVEWAKDKRPVWEAVVEKYGGKVEVFDWATWGFFNWATGRSWISISSMNKVRKHGWYRTDDTFDTWIRTFRSFENAGALPNHSAIVNFRVSD
ncbi:hypothetical protein N7455_007876 [Penicillium solitum]|uniref:uncharacterized protein n=1 Tax=Penicillium solitum TaxID=60172 RepID=UPI0017D27514|nr:hypothetical protein HAV15_004337 [Penicillium sp. str. \